MSNITTYTKISMDPTKPTPDEIEIRDIAHALSLMCRANGHFPHFYSVAQHCNKCCTEALARGLSTRIQLICLLHDASEAYLSDITRPVKQSLPTYRKIEKVLQDLIYKKYLTISPTEQELQAVSEIDDALLYAEFSEIAHEKILNSPPLLFSSPQFAFVDFQTVEQEFLQNFEKLIPSI